MPPNLDFGYYNNIAIIILTSSILYLSSLAIYRLYLSPLAKFPGPKLAALTTWYACYYDMYLGGKYVFAVDEMHHKYGPIVRVRPDTLHVKDHSFVDTLYPSNPKHKRDRYITITNLMETDRTVLATQPHDLHRKRRSALNAYFSKQNLRQLEPVIQRVLETLLRRMDGWAKEGKPVGLNTPFRAAANDVIQAYAFGDLGEQYLDMDDCNAAFFEVITPQPIIWSGLYFRWMMVLLANSPPDLIIKLQPRVAVFARWAINLRAQVDGLQKTKDLPAKKSIFHDLIQNETLPASEKTTSCLAETATILLQAGSETTAATLASIVYHLLTKRELLKRLRHELNTTATNLDEPMSVAQLENMPLLNAIINEGLRLHPGATHRQDRVAPDEDMVYTTPTGKIWVIPKGTPVGMSAPFLNRHPNIYDRPDEFLPDRYLDDPKLLKYLFSFSKGARQCIGMNLAYAELQVLIAGIFRKYDVYDPAKQMQTGPTLELYQTGIDDVSMFGDFITPAVKEGSKGLRVILRRD